METGNRLLKGKTGFSSTFHQFHHSGLNIRNISSNTPSETRVIKIVAKETFWTISETHLRGNNNNNGNCLLRFWLLSGNNIKIMDYRNADDPHISHGMNDDNILMHLEQKYNLYLISCLNI